MNDNQDISYTKPEDIAAKYGKSQSVKEYVKEITDHMKDDKECVVPLSVLEKANGGKVEVFGTMRDCEKVKQLLSDSKHAVFGAYTATNDKEKIVPMPESVETVTIGGISLDGSEGNNTVEQIANKMGMTTKSDSKHAGQRYNQGKLRYDLICPEQLKGLASVYTYGATKYKPHNWSKGQAYSTILASLKRHIAAFESGEDYDAESKCQHMAHAMWNCGALISFAKYYPQGDDRRQSWQRIPRIGLDVDEVLSNFVKAYCNRYSLEIPHCWNFDPLFSERMAELKDDKAFWLNLEPLIKSEQLPFEPAAYITSRIIPNEWTQEWLWLHGFPVAPVITVKHGESKVQHIQDLKLDWFIDDRFEAFAELNKQGICCFLMDAKHNQRYDVGSKRIKSLVELKERW